MIRWTQEELEEMARADAEIEGTFHKSPEERAARKKAYRHEYYMKHRDKQLAYTHAWQKANPERLKQTCRNWQQRHRKELAKYSRDYYWAHRDEILARDRERRREKKCLDNS